MGLDGFMHSRDRTKLSITNTDSFKAKMQEFVADQSSKNLIFTEDLKNMIHLSEKPDIPLLTQMIQKFNSQSKEARFGNFIFGPPVMRLFHHLQEADQALELFKDEALTGFFDQPISYQLLLDMLYKEKRYQDILDTFDIIKQRQVFGSRYRGNVIVLTFGACYKLNTPASFEYASALWKEATSAGALPVRRAVAFFAALALKQNSPHVALEVVANLRQHHYITIRTIKVLALAQLKRFDDAFPIVRAVLELDNPMANKQTFPKQSIEELKALFEGCTSNTIKSEFAKTVGFIEKQGHTTEDSLDTILTSEIQAIVMDNNNFRRDNRDGSDYGDRRDSRDGNDRRRDNRDGYGNRGYERRELDGPSRYVRRPGLHELN